jgi:hypothetical protein
VDNQATPGAPHVVHTMGFDSNNNRTALSDNLGGSTTYTSNSNQQMTEASLVVSGVQGPQVTFSYNTLHQLTGLTRQESSTGPSVSTSFGLHKFLEGNGNSWCWSRHPRDRKALGGVWQVH